ncbi:MAG: sensor histidine kinase, partial [bacterium]
KNSRKLENLLNAYSDRGTTQSQAARIAREIPGTVEFINEVVEAIQDELALYYSSDIIAAVERVLAAISPRLREEAISFKNFHVEGDWNAKGFIDETDFATLFNDVLDNALAAMQGCETKELMVKIFNDEKKVFVEVMDSGCGIKKENIDRIFDLEFSAKEEGGFGLYHAREILNKYGGKIKVTQSTPGKGTTVRLEIRRV